MLNLEEYNITMWDKEKILSFRRTLLAWYDQFKRDLPWRHTQNPYHIWVSEIMLQQTQVITVIPYYERFLKTFPTIQDLATAPEEQLLKIWEGLGYYSRVKNMQIAAQQILSQFDGLFPSTYKEILTLKGIGPYTAGAISSIAFNLPEPAVDGNVMRVLARLFEVDYDIGDSKNRKIFQAIMEILIDPQRPGDFNQAFMDLGSDIESAKKPRPEESPVRFFNDAYLHGTYDKYPIKLPPKKPKPLQIYALVISNSEKKLLIEKNTKDRLLGGFWSFPLINADDFIEESQTIHIDSKTKDLALLSKLVKDRYNLTPYWSNRDFSTITHTFSHQKWTITILEGLVEEESFNGKQDVKWVDKSELSQYPMATPQKKLLKEYF